MPARNRPSGEKRRRTICGFLSSRVLPEVTSTSWVRSSTPVNASEEASADSVKAERSEEAKNVQRTHEGQRVRSLMLVKANYERRTENRKLRARPALLILGSPFLIPVEGSAAAAF